MLPIHHHQHQPHDEGVQAPPSISLPRLPPISSLLAGLDPRSDSKESSDAATYGSLPNVSGMATWGTASPFGRMEGQQSHPAGSRPPAYPPSTKSTRLAALAPITTSAIHHQFSTSSVRGSDDAGPPTASMQPPQPRQRLPSMQLVSPTGGPLHPLPSGLVGFPPLNSPDANERTTTHPPSPAFRPRSNSVTSHPYAGPYFNSGRAELGGERRGSVGWAPHDQELARMRKRAQEQPEGNDRDQQRPRTASISSAEESRSAWHESRDRMGLSMPASSQGSPVEPQGSRRGSVDVAGDSRRSSGDSGRSHGADRPDVSPRMSGRRPSYSEQQYGRPQHHLAPEMAAMHITSPEAWRGLTSQAPIGHHRLGPSSHPPSPAPGHPPHPPYSTWAPGPMSMAGAPPLPPLPPSSTSNANFNGTPAMDDGGDSQAEVGRYGCPHCPKRFARPSSLRTHIHSHTGEKPFSCDQCGRGFSVQSNLRRHLKIHRGQSGTGTSTPTGKAKAGAREGVASDEDMAEAGGSPSEGEGSEEKAQ